MKMEDIEDTDYVASEHDRLVSAITKLDKTQHITEPTRNEPTNLNSEFNLIKKTNKLNLGNIARVLENTSHHVQISKKLKKTQDESKILSRPLEKPQAERIKRATGYEETKKRVGRWDPVVARSRTVDHVSFPLNHGSTKLQPTGEFLSKLQFKSDLEKELDELNPPLIAENEDEDEQVFPMTYEEMVEHRQHLAKIRAQQSYKAAKAKRQSKIKSKKYHRVLKKEKLKQQLKEFEELQKKDPEEALKKLESLEKDRALERHTLRHKNTGKWAKNKLIRAKYDKEVRQELAEQLAVSRSLTQKLQYNESSDDEDEDVMNPDLNLSQDSMNPWMMQRSDKSNVNSEFEFGYKKFIQNKAIKNIDSDSGSDTSDDNLEPEVNSKANILKTSVNKLVQNHVGESVSANTEVIVNQEPRLTSSRSETITAKRNKQNISITSPKSVKKLKSMSKLKTPVATSDWLVETVDDEQRNPSDEISSAFDNHQLNIEKQVENKLREIRCNIEKLEKASQQEKLKSKQKSKEIDDLEYLLFKPKNVKAILDEELIETNKHVEIKDDTEITAASNLLKSTQMPVLSSTDTNIDSTGFITVKPKYLNTALSQVGNEYDQLDDEEQVVPKVNIEEVFEEDDIVDSFRQEKEDDMNKNKPEDINLNLPGWGAWVGKGVKPQKRKKNRFIVKAPPKMTRRDENKGDIIIREHKDPKLACHKVKDVPFPFESVKDYEASIRTPLGNTFIPEKAHKKLICPSVITKAGTVIEPMDEQELLVPKNRNFKNAAVLKILGHKK